MSEDTFNASRINDLMNATLQQLSESISHQASISINSIQIPEFRGLPSEDIHAFLKRFKFATSTLSEEHRCQALNKALKDAAMIWAKANLKEFLRQADWSSIKHLLIERFGTGDRRIRYMEKLSNLKFDPKQSTLLSHVENYLATHSKAFSGQSESDAIQSLRINLPDQVVKGLNQLNDKWIDFRQASELYDLIKRYERNIMPYESRETENNSITAEALKNMLTEFKDSITKQWDQKRIAEVKTENQQLAVISSQKPSRPLDHKRYQYQRPRYQNKGFGQPRFRKQNYQDRNRYQDRNYNTNKRHFHVGTSRDSKPLLGQAQLAIEDQQRNRGAEKDNNDPSAAYYAKFGKPPYPCKYCNGNHLQRHCPTIQDDLK